MEDPPVGRTYRNSPLRDRSDRGPAVAEELSCPRGEEVGEVSPAHREEGALDSSRGPYGCGSKNRYHLIKEKKK